MTLFPKEKILCKIPSKNKDAINIAITFPSTYSVGITSLGYQNAWKFLNQDQNIRALRWFTDIKEEIKSSKSSEYVGFSFSWELDYKNIFSILEENKIPISTKNRSESDPLIFAGGQVPNANPEPFCDNFDFFILGDIEVLAEKLLAKINHIRALSRNEKLYELSKLEGIYVPSVATAPVKREFTKGVLSFSSIIAENSVWPNTFLLEVVRSCPELCRFCLASYASLPFRTPDLKEHLIPAVDFGLKYTNKIGLLGASVTQHPEFDGLISYLLEKNLTTSLNVQIASLRADTLKKEIIEGLYKLGASSITMAIETGSDKLRDFINKKVSNETILDSVSRVYGAGFNSIKLYGMVGLPSETEEDLKATIDFLKTIKVKNKGKKLVWGCSVFVPKAQTPFQWYGVDHLANKKLGLLKKELHKIGVDFRPESFEWATIQALISRGNRSINKILVDAYRYGGTLGSFKKAIRENSTNTDSEHFIFENWDKTIKLPWENTLGYLNKEVILKHSGSLS